MSEITRINLPAPDKKGGMPLTEAIATRKSVRDFKPDAISLSQLSQILWAAQGKDGKREGYRMAPSAGATYPMEIFFACGDDGVEGLRCSRWARPEAYLTEDFFGRCRKTS